VNAAPLAFHAGPAYQPRDEPRAVAYDL